MHLNFTIYVNKLSVIAFDMQLTCNNTDHTHCCLASSANMWSLTHTTQPNTCTLMNMQLDNMQSQNHTTTQSCTNATRHMQIITDESPTKNILTSHTASCMVLVSDCKQLMGMKLMGMKLMGMKLMA